MNQALVQDSEHDINGEDRGGHKIGLASQRLLKGLQRSGELTMHGRRNAELLLDVLNLLGRLAQRDALSQIEVHRDRGKQAGVIHGQRRGGRRILQD